METVLCSGDVIKVRIIFQRNQRYLIVFHGFLLEIIAQKHFPAMGLVSDESFEPTIVYDL